MQTLGPLPHERTPSRVGGALGVSLAWHAAMALLLFAAFRHGAGPVERASAPWEPLETIVWLAEPGPGGGGGGGGNEQPEPPRLAEVPGPDPVTLPVAAPPVPTPTPEAPAPIEPLAVPVQPLTSGRSFLTGGLQTPVAPTVSQGAGTGAGAGAGEGAGMGDGIGPGLGPGRGGGTGDGVYRPGSGVTSPVPRYRATPTYTADAVRARVQGVVLVQCVVETDGVCSNPRVVRSLDPRFGLDEEAIRTAGRWRFVPGTRMGEPVRMLVTIEVGFAIH
jgi:protein TonB